MVGHLLKVISFLLLYKATVEATLKDPYQVLFRDLNQREEALRESEGRYRISLKRALTLSSSLTPSGKGTILSANPAACRMFGRTEQEMIGLSRDDMFAPHQPELASLLKERERAASYTGELTYRRADGTTFPGEVSTSFFTDSNGNLTSVAMVRDITERRRAEEALRDSERLYRAIGESMDYGVWVCTPDGRNTYASESFLRMVGITQEQCSNFGWGDVLHPDDAERTIARWKECVKTGGTWDIEHRFPWSGWSMAPSPRARCAGEKGTWRD